MRLTSFHRYIGIQVLIESNLIEYDGPLRPNLNGTFLHVFQLDHEKHCISSIHIRIIIPKNNFPEELSSVEQCAG